MPPASIRKAVPLALAFGIFAVSASPSLFAATDDLLLDETLAERVEASWEAKIGGDWEMAYGFLTPGYREATPFPQWRAQFGGVTTWRAASVQEIACNDELDRCRVDVALTHVVSLPQFGIRDQIRTRRIQETWILVGDEWWHFPQ